MFFYAELNIHGFPGGGTLNPGSAKQQNIKYTYTHNTHIPIYPLCSIFCATKPKHKAVFSLFCKELCNLNLLPILTSPTIKIFSFAQMITILTFKLILIAFIHNQLIINHSYTHIWMYIYIIYMFYILPYVYRHYNRWSDLFGNK